MPRRARLDAPRTLHYNDKGKCLSFIFNPRVRLIKMLNVDMIWYPQIDFE